MYVKVIIDHENTPAQANIQDTGRISETVYECNRAILRKCTSGKAVLDLEGRDSVTIETDPLFCFSIYYMNEEGKTIDRKVFPKTMESCIGIPEDTLPTEKQKEG